MWEYIIYEKHLDAFKKSYDKNGEWCKLFVKADGYIKTVFYQDISNPKRFVTIDYWENEDALEKFRNDFEDEYEELDSKCDEFTEIEVFIGDFKIESDNSDSISFYDVFK